MDGIRAVSILLRSMMSRFGDAVVSVRRRCTQEVQPPGSVRSQVQLGIEGKRSDVEVRVEYRRSVEGYSEVRGGEVDMGLLAVPRYLQWAGNESQSL